MLTDPTGLCAEQSMVKNHGVNTWAARKVGFWDFLGMSSFWSASATFRDDQDCKYFNFQINNMTSRERTKALLTLQRLLCSVINSSGL